MIKEKIYFIGKIFYYFLFLLSICAAGKQIKIMYNRYCHKNKSNNSSQGINMKESFGKVIILNGPSAAGKTTLQRAFQEKMREKNELWLAMGIDALFDPLLPEITKENVAFYQNKNSIRWVEASTDDKGKPIISLFLGKDRKKVITGMHEAIIAYANAGCNVIVDYILYDESWYNEFEKLLSEVPHVWVKIDISLEECEKREKMRNTSPVGHARSHWSRVHEGVVYDATLSVNKKNSDILVEELLTLVAEKNN
jgi:chloramphenicol 3-O phosphotransferase